MIDYSVRGEGEPLVLIHGLFGTRENLAGIARLLSENFTVYSIDLPNHGRSATLQPFDLESMAVAVQMWMQEISLSSAHFFGHSLGGKAAMELALTVPQCVDKLIVADIAPVHYANRHTQVFAGLLALDLATLSSRGDADKQLAHYVEEKPVRSFLLKNLQKPLGEGFSWRMNLNAIYAGYADLIKANTENTFNGATLFLKAEHSDYIQQQYTQATQARFPAGKYKMVANTSHWLHAEKPELIARLVTRFIRD